MMVKEQKIKMRSTSVAFGTALVAAGFSAMLLAGVVSDVHAAGAEPAGVKIGMVTTLSGGGGYLGEDMRDGFLLAIEQEQGKLGGVGVTMLIEDDAFKPGNGKQIADRFIDAEKVDILTGVIFSNVAGAVVPSALKAGKFYISPNAAPSQFAGAQCNENYFAVAWQNDNSHEAAGATANQLGYKNAFILAPNYPAGQDALAGFKRFFKGAIVNEVYTKLGQTDYAAEIAQIRDAKPDVVFHFLPGGMGINFMKQYAQSGLKETTPMVVSEFSIDAKIIGAIGDAAKGVYSASHWNADIEVPANREFTQAFRARYNREPTIYAAQGYDTAKLIGSALKASAGDVHDQKAFRNALRRADFNSVRGAFRFGNNHHPIQDWYSRVVVAGADGKLANQITGKILTNHQDAYAKDCLMQW